MALIVLHAGPLSMLFDRERAFLRRIRIGDRELVRGVVPAIRDQNWNTIPFRLRDFALHDGADRFDLSFLATCAHGDIQFDWKGTLWGRPEGTIGFRFEGEARSTFLKNRIGLCVLHPIRECAGERCEVAHTDGTVTRSQFPRHVSPNQPFQNIRSITHTVSPGLDVRVTFHGEVFEMEDQRNWTDASFKTYSTPLALPFPGEITPGTKVSHEVTLTLIGAVPRAVAVTPPEDEPVRVTVDWSRARGRPPLGLCMATGDEEPTTAALARLQRLAPDHLRVELRLGRPGWMDEARRAIDVADALGSRLEVAVFTTDANGAHWRACLNLFGDHRHHLARWLVFHPDAKATPSRLAGDASRALAAFDASVPLVVGTDVYFAELNRNRLAVPDDGFVCFSVNPQVHAVDNMSICETLEAYDDLVASAQALFGRPVVISPITLRPRFNPNATSVTEQSQPEADPRQATSFAAAWTVGALSQLATNPDVASLTFYETFGARGVVSIDGTPFPVFGVFETLRDCQSVSPATMSRPVDVAALGVSLAAGERAVLLANMTDVDRTVEVGDAGEVKSVTMKAESVRLMPMRRNPTARPDGW